MFPQKAIPVLPRKNARKTSEQAMARRMKMMAFFLGQLYADRDLFYNEYTIAFLSQNNKEKFEAQLEKGSKLQEPTCASDYNSFDGFISCDPDAPNVRQGFEAFMADFESEYKAMTSTAKKIEQHLREARTLFYSLGDHFSYLFKRYQQLDAKSPLPNCCALLNNVVYEMGESLDEVANCLNSGLVSYFRYLRHETYSIRELTGRLAKAEQQQASMPTKEVRPQVQILKEAVFLSRSKYGGDVWRRAKLTFSQFLVGVRCSSQSLSDLMTDFLSKLDGDCSHVLKLKVVQKQ